MKVPWLFITHFLYTILSLIPIVSFAQHENKNWYFGDGPDGIVFDSNNNPVKVSNKYPELVMRVW